MSGSNYIIKEREFIKSKENILKIGQTEQPETNRASQYPKGSVLILQRFVNDRLAAEREIIKVFDEKFINRPDIGREYYEGAQMK